MRSRIRLYSRRGATDTMMHYIASYVVTGDWILAYFNAGNGTLSTGHLIQVAQRTSAAISAANVAFCQSITSERHTWAASSSAGTTASVSI